MLGSTPLMLFRAPIRSALNKQMPTGVKLCQSQRLASAQRLDASREAAKQAVLAAVQADIDNVVHTDACCHIRQQFSHEPEHQGRRSHQGGSREQVQQQQNSEGLAHAAATAVRSQGKAVRNVGLAVTDGEVQLRSFSCACCDVWNVMPEAVAYQRWRHVVRPLEDPDELAAHLQKIAAQPGNSIAFLT